MPKAIERKIRKRGGATRWRTKKRGKSNVRIAVVRKNGPRGGRTVGYKIKRKK